ncbi:SNF2-related protein [Oceanirhabdus seepicola]|uniref:DEAD/DEAH box helicase family protein n=1 Tax=Oceanirhabdus seepicola TaxID=2828781 RepID=A0A9J6NXP0_9CLOT|nr:SNF2-related protein [Oceanirhabdus seepicola]MCM1988828.1 DEAD/DEAH box helicase family protein [Oceanirhabdus seepicola]
MSKYKKGMYVRCPIDYEDDRYPRMFATGQIDSVDNDFNMVTVEFHNIEGDISTEIIYSHVHSKKEYLIKEIRRCSIMENSKIVLSDFNGGRIVSKKGREDGLYTYYVELENGNIGMYSEEDILAHFTRGEISPVIQMLDYEFHNSFWYEKRSLPSESMHIINNFAHGFNTLIGARAYLMTHQIDTIIRAICEEPCRFMLADEVGLGKTIEACVIMNGLKKKKHKFRTLIIAPNSLCRQWQNELDLKFWIEAKIIENPIDLEKEEILLLPLEEIRKYSIKDILKKKWDLCIVDETHRLVKMDSEYKIILEISKEITNILLLSATPIQERKEEFLSLLKLLNPKKYVNMSEIDFNSIYKKSQKIKSHISSMYGELDDFDEEVAEDILDELEEVSEILNDSIVNKLIKEIDIDSDDNGLEIIKIVLAYISENYQIENNIIRHRRAEIKDKLAERACTIIDYDMSGSELNYYERDTYEVLLNYIDVIQKNNIGYNVAEYVKILLSSMFSSPWALKDVISYRISLIEENKYSSFRNLQQNTVNAINKVLPSTKETESLMEVQRALRFWCRAAEDEFNKLEELYNDPDLINGRLIKMLDYIEEEYDNTKYVIFSSWTSTVEKTKSLLEEKYGKDAVAGFYSNMDEADLEKNVFKFQSKKECRFMVCDELGGEGRNFQIADKIIHVDIPFSPITLEQRIGRLDRIGRNKDNEVESIVMLSNDNVESDLFNLWDEGLNIFRESLSGMEIALEDIQNQITNALSKDINNSVGDILENIKLNSANMKKLVNKERHFDLARNLDRATEEKINKLIEKFDSSNGELMGRTMKNWAVASGFHADYENANNNDIILYKPQNVGIKSLKNTLFMLPDTREIIKRNKKNAGVFRGTFSRETAVKNEELIFFAPGETIFDSIMRNSQEGYRGRCCAVKLESNDIQWTGFVFKWNVKFNMDAILDKDINILEANKSQGYLPLEQITTIVKVTGNDDIDENIIKDMRLSNHIHIGKRHGETELVRTSKELDMSNLEYFMRKYPKAEWRSIVKESFDKAANEAKKKVIRSLDINKVRKDFEKVLNGKIASNIYFENNKIEIDKQEKLEKVLKSVEEGIKTAKLELDSVLYLWSER